MIQHNQAAGASDITSRHVVRRQQYADQDQGEEKNEKNEYISIVLILHIFTPKKPN